MIMAERDAVTGIYTKFKFYRTVRELLSENTEETFAFARFDIDRFKMINNFYGVKEGDKVLQTSRQSFAEYRPCLTILSMDGWKMMCLQCVCPLRKKMLSCWSMHFRST